MYKVLLSFVAVTCAQFGFMTQAVAAPSHIVIVIEENHNYGQVVGNQNMPYLNHTLIAGGLLLVNSHGVVHPSQPNYLDLFSGSNEGVTNDGSVPGSSNIAAKQTPLDTANIAAAMIHAGYTFAAYSQSLPAAGSLAYYSDGTMPYKAVPSDNPGAFIYARKHNPWTNWQATSGYAKPGNSRNTLPPSVNQPFWAFPTNFNRLPTLAFVIPNQCNDMHGGVSGSTTTQNCPYAKAPGDPNDVQLQRNADNFLSRQLGPYARWARRHNSLLIVTWDESYTSEPNHIATVFYGGGILPGSVSEQHVNDYDILATLADYYHLDRSKLGQAAIAVPVFAALSR